MQVSLVARPADRAAEELYVHLLDADLDPGRSALVDEARALRARLGADADATLEITVANDLGVRLDPHEHPWLEQAIAAACAAFAEKPH
ncbi:MAG TPA: hypothetical protein VK066_10995 [Chloroflexota bacterium]|nr:hypothetical protein [Chloroflexota bacterium]